MNVVSTTRQPLARTEFVRCGSISGRIPYFLPGPKNVALQTMRNSTMPQPREPDHRVAKNASSPSPMIEIFGDFAGHVAGALLNRSARYPQPAEHDERGCRTRSSRSLFVGTGGFSATTCRLNSADGFRPAVSAPAVSAPAGFSPRRPLLRRFCTAARHPTFRPQTRLRPRRSGSRARSSSCLNRLSLNAPKTASARTR